MMAIKPSVTIFLLMLAISVAGSALASHIVGSDIGYRCLGPGTGNTTRYEIRLVLYQDCIGGQPLAIAEDNPAFIGVYNAITDARLFIDSISASSFEIVPPNFSNNCVNNAPATCLRKATFIKTYDLPNNQPFRVVYQRCCRNSSVLNILSPGITGATYFCTIPAVTPSSPCNNSAVFKNTPPQIICINNPLIYDHSAVDPDGDSLSYEFCQTYVGGDQYDAKPIPPPPPYQPVIYVAGFSHSNPMGGNPLVQIHPQTGMITGTPNIAGRYVVTVCCHEWRNGVIVNTVMREFQFVVTNCSKAVVADIPQYSEEPNTYIVECASKTVKFDNYSTGGFEYYWDFGVPGDPDNHSSAFSPTFTYPDTGTYMVKLVVNRGSTCPDSISRIVKIYPTFFADFSFEGLQCPNTPIQFNDSVSGTSGNPSSWLWDFNDGHFSGLPNPVHSFDTGGIYNVTLLVKNQKGCIATAEHEVVVEQFYPFAGNDTIIVKGEIINFNAQGGGEGGQYHWSPSDNLNNPFVKNPVGNYPDTGRFTYVVDILSENFCSGSDTISVWVVGQPSLFVPTAFTPNGDGRNDILKPIGIGYNSIRFFRVLNRWGELVFHTTQFNHGWDGNWKGKPAEIGVYFWVLSVTDRFGAEELIKGDATLIR